MPDSIRDPVFIVGLPRTASKWLQNAINTYTECCVVHEMHVLSLWRRGAHSIIKEVIRDRSGKEKVDALMELVLSRRLFGGFWRAASHQYTIFCLESEELRAALSSVEDGRTMLAAMIEAQRLHYGKLRAGARHPVHFVYLGTLLKWFPDARIVFLTRESAEIERSQRAKRISRQATMMRRVLLSTVISLHTRIQALLAAIVLWRWSKDPRVLKVSYRELVEHPSRTFKRICAHLQITFDPRMADSSRKYDSSFDEQTWETPPYAIEWTPKDNERKSSCL